MREKHHPKYNVIALLAIIVVVFCGFCVIFKMSTSAEDWKNEKTLAFLNGRCIALAKFWCVVKGGQWSGACFKDDPTQFRCTDYNPIATGTASAASSAVVVSFLRVFCGFIGFSLCSVCVCQSFLVDRSVVIDGLVLERCFLVGIKPLSGSICEFFRKNSVTKEERSIRVLLWKWGEPI